MVVAEIETREEMVDRADFGAMFDADALTVEQEQAILKDDGAAARFEGQEELDDALKLFDYLALEQRLLADGSNWEQATEVLEYFLDHLVNTELMAEGSVYLRGGLDQRAEALEQVIEEQAGEVRQNDQFRHLEGIWRELRYEFEMQSGMLEALEDLDYIMLDEQLASQGEWDKSVERCNYLTQQFLSDQMHPEVESRFLVLVSDRIESFDYAIEDQDNRILADARFRAVDKAWQRLKAVPRERHRKAVRREIEQALAVMDQVAIDEQLELEDPNWNEAIRLFRYFLAQVTGGIIYQDISDETRVMLEQRIAPIDQVIASKQDEFTYEAVFQDLEVAWLELKHEIEGEEELSLLDQILIKGRLAPERVQHEKGYMLLGVYLIDLMQNNLNLENSRQVGRMIGERIAMLDRLLSAQLNEILHHPKFQRLEASWRCLRRMADSVEFGRLIKLRILPISKKELLSDFQKAIAFDQSQLFKKVYEVEYGTLGGEPYGVLMGDYEFSNHPADIELLQSMSELCAAAHAPFITSASPTLFDLDSYSELDRPRSLARNFESTQMAKWRSFRNRDESRYVALTLPRALVRLPYSPDGQQGSQEMNFVEEVEGLDSSKYLWGLVCWSLTECVMRAFARHGWCAWIRGLESGGRVNNLPVQGFKGDSGGSAFRPPVESQVSDSRDKELAELGFIALNYVRNTTYAAFYSASTANLPPKYNNNVDADTNARLSSMLQYILTASRFAHYVKSIMRDKIGGFESQATMQSYLNDWISQYITQDDNATLAIKARYPLREARIDVVEVPGKPGKYSAIIYIRPHFQLEELTSSIKLQAHLPSPASAG